MGTLWVIGGLVVVREGTKGGKVREGTTGGLELVWSNLNVGSIFGFVVVSSSNLGVLGLVSTLGPVCALITKLPVDSLSKDTVMFPSEPMACLTTEEISCLIFSS